MRTDDLPRGDAKPALRFPHFPTRQQAFVWRNWGLVPTERLAAVLATGPDEVLQLGADMGLPVPPAACDHWIEHGYTTVLRANWHLLPYEQILQLLDWTPDHMAYMFVANDGTYGKLGGLKPEAARLVYRPLTAREKERTARLKQVVERHFPQHRAPASDQPFSFLQEFEQLPPERVVAPPGSGLRLIYAYAAPYGDTLLDESLNPYPDGLLARYAQLGVNGIWMQGLLHSLVPIEGALEHSKGYEQRQQNLRKLVERAARFGIGVYLYFNEPRGMPGAFFKDLPEWRGVRSEREEDRFALCTSKPEVQEHLRNAPAALFREVPGLAGVIVITVLEQITNCWSHYQDEACPICSARSNVDVLAEVNNLIEEGVHSTAPQAHVIAWNWGWHKFWAKDIVDRLNPGVELMCTSEDFIETNVAGVPFTGLEYSMSQIGPTPHTRGMLAHAQARGLKTHVKVQINNTWECSAVPYIPVPFLVEEHLNAVRAAGADGLMLSWTLGGYPGGNLELLDRTPQQLAEGRFGPAAPLVLEAWQAFGRAFRNFPFSVIALYNAPQNMGCANLLYASPTGYTASIVNTPYDDLDYWRTPYPADVFEEQFRKMTEGWRPGLALLAEAAADAEGPCATALSELSDVAWATYCHLRTAYLQIAFVRHRDEQGFVLDERTRAIVGEEIELAKTLYTIMRRDSRIGFEATNHYYYTANDLVEKVLNCEHLLEEEERNTDPWHT